jgi:hypothetical protein
MFGTRFLHPAVIRALAGVMRVNSTGPFGESKRSKEYVEPSHIQEQRKARAVSKRAARKEVNLHRRAVIMMETNRRIAMSLRVDAILDSMASDTIKFIVNSDFSTLEKRTLAHIEAGATEWPDVIGAGQYDKDILVNIKGFKASAGLPRFAKILKAIPEEGKAKMHLIECPACNGEVTIHVSSIVGAGGKRCPHCKTKIVKSGDNYMQEQGE